MISLAVLDSLMAEHGGRPALAPVTATLERGRVRAVSGPNGSGKSTLLFVLAGLHPASGGAITWTPRRPRVAFAVQRSTAGDGLALTVAELVAMGRWAHRAPWARLRDGDHRLVHDTLTALDLIPLARRPLAALSGGQRQRALVARAVAQRADLLLLDEPATGLDAHSRRLIDAIMRAEADRGAAVVHATHDVASIADSDDVLELSSP